MSQTEKLYCRGCGAALPIKANIGRVKCEFCGTINVTATDQKADSSHPSCPNCGFVNTETAQFCGHCGKPLYHACPNCGTKNRIEIHFCIECGADIEKAIRVDKPTQAPNTDDIYADYLREAQRLFKKFQRAYLPWGIFGIFLIFGDIYLWISANISSMLFYLVLILCFTLTFVASTIAQKKANDEARVIAKSKPGFDKFQKSFFKNRGWVNWPQTLNERWRKKFLSIIGKA